jgi:hypothetical protein
MADDITVVSVVIPQKLEETVVETDEDDLEFEDEEGSEDSEETKDESSNE